MDKRLLDLGVSSIIEGLGDDQQRSGYIERYISYFLDLFVRDYITLPPFITIFLSMGKFDNLHGICHIFFFRIG